MEQEFSPSFALQPKLNTGFWPDDDVVRLSVTLWAPTVPFGAHTLTFHWAFWPRATLAWSRCRLTHRPDVEESVGEGVGEAADDASVRVKLSSVAVLDALPRSWVMNAMVLAVCVPLPDPRPLIRDLSRPLLVSGEPDTAVVVGDDVVGGGDVVVVPGEVGRIVGGVGGVVLDGLDGVLVPEPELEPDGLKEGLGEGLACTWTQSCLVAPLTADVCAVWVRPADAAGARRAAGPSDTPAWPDVAAATMPKLEADTTRKPPAARLTVDRTCGKRMKALPLPGCCFCETILQIWRGYFRRISPRLNDASILDTKPIGQR